MRVSYLDEHIGLNSNVTASEEDENPAGNKVILVVEHFHVTVEL